MKREFTFTNVLKDAKSNTKHYQDRLLQNEDGKMERYYQSKFMEALQYQKGLIVA
jgi:competence protein ComGF